ncbi:hypothetical protein K3495_g12003 [Podosphaera aphanis]|nr:hypothetical protein K3495_g12003 [Podosphaera aphanis]
MSQVQPAAQTNNSKRLNRDQHLQIKTLHDSGMNQTSNAKQLGIFRNQVGYTLCTPYIEHKKAAGRPPTLSSSDVFHIEFSLHHPLKVVEFHGLNLPMAPFGILE